MNEAFLFLAQNVSPVELIVLAWIAFRLETVVAKQRTIDARVKHLESVAFVGKVK